MPDSVGSLTKKPKVHKIRRDFMHLTANIASVATAIEALEQILIEKGVLKADELMERLKKVATEHWARGENLPPNED